MKNFITVVAVLTCLLFAYAFQKSNNTLQTIDLASAIAQQKVKAIFASNGSYSGESVLLGITNLTSTKLQVKIPFGTSFLTDNPEDQELIMVQDEILVLEPKSQNNIKINAYCSEASDHCPTSGSNFKLSKINSEQINKLAGFLKINKTNPSYFQDAVWAITNKYGVTSIDNSTVDGKALRKFMCEMLTIKDDWYTSPQQRTVDENQNIQSEAVSISGMLKYTSAKGAQIHSEVVKADGTKKFTSEKHSAPFGGETTFKFSLKVQGWEKGDYKVLVKEGAREIVKYDFKI